MAAIKTTSRKWLFNATEEDERMVEDERRRLAERNPGVKITRADAIRSMFTRATATATDFGTAPVPLDQDEDSSRENA